MNTVMKKLLILSILIFPHSCDFNGKDGNERNVRDLENFFERMDLKVFPTKNIFSTMTLEFHIKLVNLLV